jgi:CubicO group peptidase (beta-lactamase class C family)
MNVPASKPMQEDALFIMMSSTKPILGVAAMMLIEEGSIRPRDPVSKWIPEFAEMQVAVLREPADEDISPAFVLRLISPNTVWCQPSARLQCMTYSHIHRGSPLAAWVTLSQRMQFCG